MQLANFSPTQIKRILRAASLEREVFDAIMLAKRLGRDIREAKRRQFNLIGKILREVEPELMDNLIQITKDSDKDKFVSMFGSEAWDVKENDYDEEINDDDDDDDDDDSQHYNYLATRWYDGLISKDIGVTNEIYSLQGVEFDRQELRKLVRRMHSMQEEHQISSEEILDKTDAKYMRARRSLTRFLRVIAKQTSID